MVEGQLYNHVALPLSAETHHPNFASRHALTPGFVYDSQFEQLWCLLCRIRLAGSTPDAFVYCRLLSACSLHRSWQRGFQNGLLSGTVVSEALINAYAKCGNIELCEKVFDEERASGDKISISIFSAMLAGYAQSQNSGRSIWLFQQILHEGMRPDKYATSSVLSVIDVEELGKQIHSFAVKTGLACDVSVASSISTVYSKCGSLDEAFQLFEGAVERD
ncbi:hypothetical protein EJ110_NYTH18768, partial [Nymphaea thermarum]